MRGVLEPLAEFADRHNVSVLAVTHPPKATQAKALHAITGSLEALLRWAGLANSWMVQEIECGCVTGTNDCVFTISSAKVH